MQARAAVHLAGNGRAVQPDARSGEAAGKPQFIVPAPLQGDFQPVTKTPGKKGIAVRERVARIPGRTQPERPLCGADAAPHSDGRRGGIRAERSV